LTPLRTRNQFVVSVLLGLSLAFPSVFVRAAVVPSSEPAADPDPAAISYDVMSIKLNNTASGSSGMDTDDGHFSAHNVSLKVLLSQAYDIKQDLISGISGPVESARFDIEAKVVEPDTAALKKMTREQRRVMLLPLLIDRFQLKTHIEIKQLPVYELVVAKGGAKCKLSADQNNANGDMNIDGSRTTVKLSAQDVSLASFAKSLSSRVDRTVIDKTGLAGNYNIDLQWSNEDNPDSGADPLPSIFTAIQEQLGLRLQPAHGPVETLVVDHAAMPTEN
jgi:uncharacterized protein (TIGR03435 family)